MASREIQTARVPKITPVKEGQQYPVGKGGQYKLFHEHVWPKGYSPQRMQQINKAQFGLDIVPHANLVEDNPKIGPHNIDEVANKVARSHVLERLARSTVPMSDIDTVTKDRLLTVKVKKADQTSKSMDDTTPYFRANTNTINLPIDENATDVDVQDSLIHELGHAVDFAENPGRMRAEFIDVKQNPIDFMYGNTTVPPVSEGFAEGYTTGHSRITRGQRKIGGNISRFGYKPDAWFFPDAGEAFTRERNATFQRATGVPFEEPQNKPKGVRPSKQMNLFED